MTERKNINITPRTRVGELLEAYPELEPILIKMAPVFRKLKNPILRRTIGKVATLQQAATIGDITVTEIVNALRAEAGHTEYDDGDITEDINYEKPSWFDEVKVTIRIDATPLINSGENPMKKILNQLKETGKEEIFLLKTPFAPAPIIDLIAQKGYFHYCVKKEENEFHTYFFQPSE